MATTGKKPRVLLIPFFATNLAVSLLQRIAANVKVAMYPFPAADGLSEGVENHGKAAPADSWRIDAAAVDKHVDEAAKKNNQAPPMFLSHAAPTTAIGARR
ncbi:hypothetical protein ZWY2020_051366 [Hordeum vulgare]|nr:hypothetical protein ZWY2020_051366 [Hordeum vulgare]